MDIELLYKDTGFLQKPLTVPGLNLEIDTSWIRAYQLTVLEGQDFILRNQKNPCLLVAMNTSTIQTNQAGTNRRQALSPGNFLPVKRNGYFSLKNVHDQPLKFVMLEFPQH
jgi:hypothetical protein